MKNIVYGFIYLSIILLSQSCNSHQKNKDDLDTSFDSHLTTWADTIIYEVMISNPDTTNKWESQKLKDVSNKNIVDDIFDMVYNNDKVAYNYYTHQPMSIKDIEQLEKNDNFSRDKIGKLQFTEVWKMDKANQILHKKVLSILIAYELYNADGDLRGYKAAFYINL